MGESKHSYEATADGCVYSTTGWRGQARRKLQQTLNASGYPSVRIVVDGRRKHLPVHRLVAERFLGARPSDQHEVCHIDGNRLNNTASNLRWGTRKDNADDRERHGRTSRGPAHSAAILFIIADWLRYGGL